MKPHRAPFRYIPTFFFLLLTMTIPLAVTSWGAVSVVDQGHDYLQILYTADGDDWRHADRRCLLGMPENGTVSLDVLEAVEVSGPRQLSEDEAEKLRADHLLQGPAQLDEPGFLRHQRVVALLFGPELTAADELRLFDRVLVQVRFSGGRETGARSEAGWSEELYRGSLLNYEQARNWRIVRSRPAQRSAQARGQRVRMTLREQGLYRVAGSDLEALGVSLADVDPAGLRVMYGGGEILPLEFPEGEFELRERPILVEDGGDGSFESGDYLLFDGQGVSRWQYEEETRDYRYVDNPYTLDNVYWLELGEGEGLRARKRTGAPTGDGRDLNTYRVRLHQESEKLILLQTYGMKSGYEWYWEDFTGNARNYPVVIQGAAPGLVEIRLGFYGWTDINHRFDVKWNDKFVDNVVFSGKPFSMVEVTTTISPREGVNLLGLVHTDGNSSRLTRFDWYEVEFNRDLAAERDELIFDSRISDGLAEFSLEGFGSEAPRIFEVSDGMVEIVGFDYDPKAGTVVFEDEMAGRPASYLVAGPSRWKRPRRMVLDSPAVLRSAANRANYVVITHEDFASAAERLAAWRGSDDRFGDPLEPMVVDVRDVYDEFSGGLLDPTAIRNFLLWAANNWSMPPLFVNLFGDGSYDYKNNSGTSLGNWIPPYQDGDSTYDEWYVRVAGDDPYADMAIGRMTVQTLTEADNVVDKLITYDREPETGPWQSRVLLVADDITNPSEPDIAESFFLLDTEFLAAHLLPQGIDVIKHYIGAFAREGSTKPKAREEYIRLFNEGAAVLTYVGHGNPEVLAHEQMFVLTRDVADIRNEGRLPLMYTAASQVGVFDDPVRASMPEVLLNKTDGGVIGMISATRVGFHASNMVLARLFHNQMYRSGRSHVPVGLALMEAKVIAGAGWRTGGGGSRAERNIQRYSLIGDPATRLVLPRYMVSMEVPDTWRALQEVLVTGRILRADGAAAGDFDGKAMVQAFDSAVQSRIEELRYQQLGSHLFRGIVDVVAGRFETRFRVPKDITYKGIGGRVSAYAWATGQPPAFGSVEEIRLTGTQEDVELDSEGPTIILGFVGQQEFEDGDFVPTSPIVTAAIFDAGGINITGETGHEISLTVDGVVTRVTDSFISSDGDYRRGRLEHQISALEPGDHEIRLKAWDSFNNSAVAGVTVRVGDADEVIISDLLFHPNPLDGSTGTGGHFTFNLFNPAASLRIQVYSLSGRLVEEIEAVPEVGYNQVAWTPPVSLANGTYLYRVAVTSEDEEGRVGRTDETSAFQVMR